jgi:osmotically-inducible protein OsmY
MANNTETRSDTGIRDDVLLEIKSDPKISLDNDIAVVSKNAVVLLTGFAASFWDKDAAEEAAKRVYAVKGVANDIEVRPFWQPTDMEIARHAIRELESEVCLRADMIKVTVRNGWITLEGNVDGEYESSLACSSVQKLKGVAGVANKLQVKPKVVPQQAAKLDAPRINLNVENGMVELGGRIASYPGEATL